MNIVKVNSKLARFQTKNSCYLTKNVQKLNIYLAAAIIQNQSQGENANGDYRTAKDACYDTSN